MINLIRPENKLTAPYPVCSGQTCAHAHHQCRLTALEVSEASIQGGMGSCSVIGSDVTPIKIMILGACRAKKTFTISMQMSFKELQSCEEIITLLSFS